MPDIRRSVTGVPVSHDKSDRITVQANEVKDVVATARSLASDATTQLQFSRPLAAEDTVRVTWTGGTNPLFRTGRAIGGDATTVVTTTRIAPNMVRFSNVAGTAWTLGPVLTNDILRMERTTDTFTSPFNPANLSVDLLVAAKGSGYIDVIDNGRLSLEANITLGADYATALRVMSQTPVKVGDTVDISGTAFHPGNAGKFLISQVSSDYIEILNPYSVAETITLSTSAFNVYEFLIGFVHLRCTIGNKIKLRFDAQTEWLELRQLGDQPILLGSINCYKIQAYNDGQQDVEVSIQYARVGG